MPPQFRGEAFVRRCQEFLEQMLGSETPNNTRDENRRILSNPMNLDVVADMLSRGETPDLLQLQTQPYRVMASLIPMEQAQVLREQLIDHAVNTKDHTINDTFIELLRARQVS